MKKLHILLLALFALPMTLVADDNKSFDGACELKKPFAVSAGMTVQNRYVGFSNGAVFHPDPIVYGYVNVTHISSGFSLGVWASTGFNNQYSAGWDDEFDLCLGWGHEFDSVILTLSYAYFDCYQVGAESSTDVWKGDVLLAGKPHSITPWLIAAPYVEFESYVVHRSSPVEGGIVYSLGLTYNIQLTETLNLVSNSSIKYDDGGFGLNAGFLLRHQSTLEWKVSPRVTINTIDFTVWSPMMSDGRNVENTIGTGVRFSF